MLDSGTRKGKGERDTWIGRVLGSGTEFCTWGMRGWFEVSEPKQISEATKKDSERKRRKGRKVPCLALEVGHIPGSKLQPSSR
jgi:hypothetical protein